MRKPLSKSLRPDVMALEGRRLLAAPAGVGPIIVPVSVYIPFKRTVDVSFYELSNGQRMATVDGSDYDDVVQVLDYRPGTHGYVTLHIEQYSGGIQIRNDTASYFAGGLLGLSADASVSIQGRGGADRISNATAQPMYAAGAEGDDVIIGGGGNDNLDGGSGRNYIRGGAGDDYISAGGAQDDIIYGEAGNDTIGGGDGNNTLSGDDGDDRVFGGAGDERIDGGAGNDLLIGNAGNDVLSGGVGDDFVYGDTQQDYTVSGDGNDVLSGGDGNDHVEGGGANDVLHGDAGDDSLYGNEGRDTLFGDDGNDYLNGGYWSSENINEPDFLVGGAGADTFVRHKSFFFSNDIDVFADYNSAQDSVETIWHW